VARTIEAAHPVEDQYRHPIVVRVWHWLTAVTALGLLFTGTCVLDVHPRLYWGEVGNESTPAVVAVESAGPAAPGQPAPTVLTLGERHLNVTGLMGVPLDLGPEGMYFLIFPLPDSWHFGGMRAWHFALAWVMCLSWLGYCLYLTISGRLRRVLVPEPDQLKPAAVIHDLWNHLRLRRPRGREAQRYNLLQKVTYLGVLGAVVPLLVMTGLTMSNAVTIRFPWLFSLFAGRESARTLHALAAGLLLLFVIIHIVQLIVVGPVNRLRAMTTGFYRIPKEAR